MLQEHVTLSAILGIIFIVFGSYILNVRDFKAGFFSPIKNILCDRGLQYMLLVAFLFSIAVNTDKLNVTNSNPYFSGGYVLSILGICYLIGYGISPKTQVYHLSQSGFHLIFIAGLFLAAEALTINIAYTLSSVALVISIKRLSIIISVILGIVILKEQYGFTRLLGSIIMVLGAVILLG
jgi:uncharacterized membrane protein